MGYGDILCSAAAARAEDYSADDEVERKQERDDGGKQKEGKDKKPLRYGDEFDGEQSNNSNNEEDDNDDDDDDLSDYDRFDRVQNNSSSLDRWQRECISLSSMSLQTLSRLLSVQAEGSSGSGGTEGRQNERNPDELAPSRFFVLRVGLSRKFLAGLWHDVAAAALCAGRLSSSPASSSISSKGGLQARAPSFVDCGSALHAMSTKALHVCRAAIISQHLRCSPAFRTRARLPRRDAMETAAAAAAAAVEDRNDRETAMIDTFATALGGGDDLAGYVTNEVLGLRAGSYAGISNRQRDADKSREGETRQNKEKERETALPPKLVALVRRRLLCSPPSEIAVSRLVLPGVFLCLSRLAQGTTFATTSDGWSDKSQGLCYSATVAAAASLLSRQLSCLNRPRLAFVLAGVGPRKQGFGGAAAAAAAAATTHASISSNEMKIDSDTVRFATRTATSQGASELSAIDTIVYGESSSSAHVPAPTFSAPSSSRSHSTAAAAHLAATSRSSLAAGIAICDAAFAVRCSDRLVVSQPNTYRQSIAGISDAGTALGRKAATELLRDEAWRTNTDDGINDRLVALAAGGWDERTAEMEKRGLDYSLEHELDQKKEERDEDVEGEGEEEEEGEGRQRKLLPPLLQTYFDAIYAWNKPAPSSSSSSKTPLQAAPLASGPAVFLPLLLEPRSIADAVAHGVERSRAERFPSEMFGLRVDFDPEEVEAYRETAPIVIPRLSIGTGTVDKGEGEEEDRDMEMGGGGDGKRKANLNRKTSGRQRCHRLLVALRPLQPEPTSVA